MDAERSVDVAEIYPSPRRRRLIVGGCCVLVAALLVWNLPVPGVRRAVRDRLDGPFVLAQLDQSWALFAPEVSQPSWFVHLEVVRTDGSVEIIEFPSGDPWIGTYRAYRWSAYEESLLDFADLRRDALAHALDTADDPETIARVDLVLRESDVSPGDHGPFSPVYQRVVLDSVTP